MVGMPMNEKTHSDLLKLIAIITMMIDHIGVLLYPELRILRTIGRIAFPIFAWLLVQGFIHTSSRRRYGQRFLIFGVISQVPYLFLNRDMTPEYFHFNVMFLLFVGLVLLVTVEGAELAFGEKNYLKGIALSLASIAILAAPDVVQYYAPEFLLSYGTYGLIMMLIFYWTRNTPVVTAIAYVVMSVVEPYRTGVYYRAQYISPNMTYIESFMSFDLVWQQITEFKNGLVTLEGYFFQARSMMGLVLILLLQKVNVPVKIPKYVGYAFYPVHITILILIRVINGGPLG